MTALRQLPLSVVDTHRFALWGQHIQEFTADEAQEHAHKLEPFDKDAKAWLDARAVQVVQPTPAAALDQTAMADAIAKGVAMAMAAMQAAPAAQPAPGA